MSRSLRTFQVAAAAATLALALAACEPDRAITTSPDDDPAFGIALVPIATNMPSIGGVIPSGTDVDDTVIVTLSGLDSLQSGSYVIWLGNADGSAVTKATGTLEVTRVDTIINSLGDPEPDPHLFTFNNTSSFQNGGPAHQISFITTRGMSGMAAGTEIDQFFVSVESDPGVATPTPTRIPLGASLSFGVFFGNYDPTGVNIYEFTPQGSGRVFMRGDVLQFNDSTLTRPPLGYYYAAWVFKRDSATNAITDTVFFGPLTAPFPNRDQSLFNADSVITAPSVQIVGIPPTVVGDWTSAAPLGIIAATARVSADTMSVFDGGEKPFVGTADALVTLESKNAQQGRMGPVILSRVSLPGIIRFGH